MDQIVAYLKDLPNVLELLERHPFGAVVLLVAGWLAVEAIKATHGAKKPDAPPKS
jgi:hypothetical protein